MHRSTKPLGIGDREYFNEKRPVNVRVDGSAHLAEALGSCPETGSRISKCGQHSASVCFLERDFWTGIASG
jgi:hypothetical protein